MRLFWAIEIPDEIKSKLASVQEELKKLDLHAKWVEKQNIHLTVKFLGETDASMVTDIKNSVLSALEGTSPFRISVSGFGTFGNPACVIWSGIRDDDKKLFELHSKVDRALLSLGFEAEKRAFYPHLTLARLKSQRNVKLLRNKLIAMPDTLSSFTANSIKLFNSTLTPKGAIYEVIETIEIC
ncbi:RNA 2',3'-cyclic phosphodiesterase [Peptococcaceae bacterium]|nr:RNA 2',3'-cyclic phosphodiesterase [Peptococcaceae bacterium]